MFSSEKEFQHSLANFLNFKDSASPQLEVPTKYGRIDILTSNLVIECKKELTAKTIREAAGQVQSYGLIYPGRTLVIAGWSPKDLEPARVAADAVRKLGVEVWFMDENRHFKWFIQKSFEPEVAARKSISPLQSIALLVVGVFAFRQLGKFANTLLLLLALAAATGVFIAVARWPMSPEEALQERCPMTLNEQGRWVCIPKP